MARNVTSLPPDMPALNSDSDSSDSDEDAPPQQRWAPRNNIPPTRTTAIAAQPAARPDGPAANNRIGSTSGPRSASDADRAASARSGLSSSVPLQQQRNSHVPTRAPPAPAPGPQSSAAAAFSHGNCVRIIGLQARSDLNGCPGYVCGEMEKSSERWPVTVIKGPGRDVEVVKLRGGNMAIINVLDSCDPGDKAEIPPELVSRDTTAVNSQRLAQIREHHRRWHRAALHLIGHKFYCSLRPSKSNFPEGFNFRAGIQKALEENDACVKSGIPLIFLNLGEIAFGCDDLKELFHMYFKVLPAALKDLPWKNHKFSFKQPPVADFRSVPPVSFDVFGSSSLIIMRSESHSNAVVFGSKETQPHVYVPQIATDSSPQDRLEEPSREAIKILCYAIDEEFKSEQKTLLSGLCYR